MGGPEGAHRSRRIGPEISPHIATLIEFLVKRRLEKSYQINGGEGGLIKVFQESIRSLAAAIGPDDPELAPGTATLRELRAIAREDVLGSPGSGLQDTEELSYELSETILDGLVLKPIFEARYEQAAEQSEGRQAAGTGGGATEPRRTKTREQRASRTKGERLPKAATAAEGAAAGVQPKAKRSGAETPLVAPTATSGPRSWADRAAAPPVPNRAREAGSSTGAAARSAREDAPPSPPSTEATGARPPQAQAGANGAAQPETPNTSRAPRQRPSRAREQQPATRFVQVRGAPRPAPGTRHDATQYARGLFKAAGFDAAAVEAIVVARERRGGIMQVLEFKSTDLALRFMRGKAARLMALEPKVKIYLDFVSPPPTVDPASPEAKARAAAVASFLEGQGVADAPGPQPEERRAARRRKDRRRESDTSAPPASSSPTATPVPAASEPEAGAEDDDAADMEVEVVEGPDDSEGPDAVASEPQVPLNGQGLATAGGPSPDQHARQLPKEQEGESPQAGPRLALPRARRPNAEEASGCHPLAPIPPRRRLEREANDQEPPPGPPKKTQATTSGPGGQKVAHETKAPSPFTTPVDKPRRTPTDEEAGAGRPPLLALPSSPPAQPPRPESPLPVLVLQTEEPAASEASA